MKDNKVMHVYIKYVLMGNTGLIFSKYAETIPIIYATAERIFSSLKHLVTYFHSTNAEELTDSYDLISVAKEFVFISRKCRYSRLFREAFF